MGLKAETKYKHRPEWIRFTLLYSTLEMHRLIFYAKNWETRKSDIYSSKNYNSMQHYIRRTTTLALDPKTFHLGQPTKSFSAPASVSWCIQEMAPECLAPKSSKYPLHSDYRCFYMGLDTSREMKAKSKPL